MLLVAFAVAFFEQGAFYAQAQSHLGLFLVSAVLLQPAAVRIIKPDRPFVLLLALLAAWALVDGALNHQPSRGLSYLFLLLGFVALYELGASLSGLAGRLLEYGLVGLVAVVAGSGMVGVALHNSWGFSSDQLWRASSVVTYPNALAALCAMFALLSLAELCRTPDSVFFAVAAVILLAGLAETLSRAGLIGLAVGLTLLFVRSGVVVAFRSCRAPLMGSTVAITSAYPSMLASEDLRTALMAGGFVVGCFIGAGLPRFRVQLRIGVEVLVGLALVSAIAVGAGSALHRLTSSRATFHSPERLHANLAAWETLSAHPWFGAGPGLRGLDLSFAGGGIGRYRYAHNEYLQILAELGLVGAVLLIAAVGCLVRRLQFRRYASADSAREATASISSADETSSVHVVSRVGVVAALCALVVHAGFDFLLHFPVIPLLAAVLIGAITPTVTDPEATEFDNTRLLDFKEKEAAL
jgi:hypothetical protein